MEKEAAKCREGAPAVPLDPAIAAQLLSAAGTAGNLGFMKAPVAAEAGHDCPPDCDEPHTHVHGSGAEPHEHDHGEHEHGEHEHGEHAHDEHEHEHDEHEHDDDDAHAHMLVFPAFELDDEGQLVETLGEQGNVTKEGLKLRKAAASGETSGKRQRKRKS